MDKLFLGAIFTYLGERVPATNSQVMGERSLRLYDTYVEFRRRRHGFTISVGGHVAKVAPFRLDGGLKLRACTVDLQHPSSLQQIYEFTMGKQFR